MSVYGNDVRAAVMKIIDIDQTLLRLRELADSGVLTLDQAETVRNGVKVIEHLR